MPTTNADHSQSIAVIGAGHVGLVTAVGFTHHGFRVRVGEADPARLALLRGGGVPFREPDLDQLVAEGVNSGLLSFHASNAEAAAGATAVFLAVPTPAGSDGSADLTFVEAAVRSIAPVAGADTVVVAKSSVPPGSWRKIRAWMDAAGCSSPLVVNPEFLQEGRAVAGVLGPARVVVGSDDPAAADLVARLHGPFGAPVVRTDPTSAELIKYAANAYLAMRVTFANTVANLAEAVGADFADVVAGIGLDPRIGTHFLQAGPGFGGSCFPKDLPALVATGRSHGLDAVLFRAVVEANAEQPLRVVAKVADALGGLDGKRVALLGLAFKAGTDDTAESPALAIAAGLVAAGAVVVGYDPQARADLPGLGEAASAIEALTGADALVIATEWEEFGALDPADLVAAMAGTVVVDARNVMDPVAARAAGLDYRGIGR